MFIQKRILFSLIILSLATVGYAAPPKELEGWNKLSSTEREVLSTRVTEVLEARKHVYDGVLTGSTALEQRQLALNHSRDEISRARTVDDLRAALKTAPEIAPQKTKEQSLMKRLSFRRTATVR